MFGKPVLFLSDLHLGVDARERSIEREKRIVRFLEAQVANSIGAVFLNGDTFDFWYEYKRVIPKGFSRFLGCLARLRDAQIPIEILSGNHDLWFRDYFPQEFGIPVHFEGIQREINGKHLLIAHGDGLGPGDYGYKALKKVFTNPMCKWAFSRLHPNFAVGFAQYWSKTSRHAQGEEAEAYQGNASEWLYQYCLSEIQKGNPADYYVFGHRHLPLNIELPNGSRYINSGDWLWHYTYAVLSAEGQMEVCSLPLDL